MGDTFSEYVATRGTAVLRFAFVLCGNRRVATDLVQDVLARARRQWTHVEAAESPDLYVRTSIVQEFLSPRRRFTDRNITVVELAPAHIDLWRSLATRPRIQRVVLTLRFYEALSDVEIAGVLDCPSGSVHRHLARGLAGLGLPSDSKPGAHQEFAVFAGPTGPGTDPLPAMYAAAATAAPEALGLLAAVTTRSHRQRFRRVAAFGTVVAIGAVALGVAHLHHGPAPKALRHGTSTVPVAKAPDQPGAVPLTTFRPPTFPYTPAWTPGEYQITYDAEGMVVFGTVGTQLNFVPTSSSWPDTVVFVSSGKPAVPGRGRTATVAKQPAIVFTNVVVPAYKDDGTRGTVVCWRTPSGTWVTLAIAPNGTAATAIREANLLANRPLPVTTTFVPGVAPTGMKLTASTYNMIGLSSMTPRLSATVYVQMLPGAAGKPANLGLYSPPGSTDETWFTFADSGGDYIRVELLGSGTFNLSEFASHLQVNVDQWMPLP